MDETILKHAVFILQHDGDTQAEPGMPPTLIYQDERIEIIGQLTPEMQLAGLIINLNLPETGDAPYRMIENTRPFALPISQPTYETAVLQWHAEGAVFERPGLWTTYLAFLVRRVQAEIEAFNLLNNVPVDDSGLFGDIPLLS